MAPSLSAEMARHLSRMLHELRNFRNNPRDLQKKTAHMTQPGFESTTFIKPSKHRNHFTIKTP
uniref:Uncharacterized protein n=1 Tax=Arion vulgaris TaxID=1028688 RepID=A0A0B7ABK5_9EUPU